MKITKEHIGMKVTCYPWNSSHWIKVLYVGDKRFFGRSFMGTESAYYLDNEWVFYKKNPKKIEAAPAVFKNMQCHKSNQFEISTNLFRSEEHAKSYEHGDILVKWPADFDLEKGVWYYEE